MENQTTKRPENQGGRQSEQGGEVERASTRRHVGSGDGRLQATRPPSERPRPPPNLPLPPDPRFLCTEQGQHVLRWLETVALPQDCEPGISEDRLDHEAKETEVAKADTEEPEEPWDEARVQEVLEAQIRGLQDSASLALAQETLEAEIRQLVDATSSIYSAAGHQNSGTASSDALPDARHNAPAGNQKFLPRN
ncbi:hypothetical protein N0V88_004836 [Collariella sp. IMI 366227]|nr:hypothetical protein N0V88_004836 [Collariella sp. IMI 366227]